MYTTDRLSNTTYVNSGRGKRSSQPPSFLPSVSSEVKAKNGVFLEESDGIVFPSLLLLVFLLVSSFSEDGKDC